MQNRPVEETILAYNMEGEINILESSSTQPYWISIAFNNKLQIREFEKKD